MFNHQQPEISSNPGKPETHKNNMASSTKFFSKKSGEHGSSASADKLSSLDETILSIFRKVKPVNGMCHENIRDFTIELAKWLNQCTLGERQYIQANL